MDFQADLPKRVYSVLRLKMNIATNAPIAGPSPVASAAGICNAKFVSIEGYMLTTCNDIRRTNKAMI